jgi:hypothetical protein
MIQTLPVLLKVPDFHRRYEEALSLVSRSIFENELKFQTAQVVLSELQIVALWKHVPDPILISLIEKLAGRTLFAWLIEGESAVEKVNRLKGEHTDPMECGVFSWRRQLMYMLGPRKVKLYDRDGKLLGETVDNYIHSPSLAELPVHMEVFGKFFPQ